MDYKEIAAAVKLCGNAPKIDQCKKCHYWVGGDMRRCILKMTDDAATAITDLLVRAEVAEADNARMREAMKPNCLLCDSMHPDNGNCTKVGGFCTAVPAAHCPLIPRLMEENDHLKDLLKEAEGRAEKAEKERDAAVQCLVEKCGHIEITETGHCCAIDGEPCDRCVGAWSGPGEEEKS